MKAHGCYVSVWCLATMVLGLLSAGCGGPTSDATKASRAAKHSEKTASDAQPVDWCPEHGLPESICVQCHPSLAADYRKKGDWCQEHKRPTSQCFACDPGLKEKFAAEYRTRYGTEPPPMEEEKETPKDRTGRTP
ncbi:MAG TPA: hypothetical protein VFA18_15730 [Gemmataceae bacterium]|nr:hypothetical protein [Gemmataceae bacterium]